MEKEKFFMNEGNSIPLDWNLSNFGMEIQTHDLNCSQEQISNCFFNPNWENSMDQSGDPFESALSSIVSSPATGIPKSGEIAGENFVLRELIGRLGSICNSNENNSTNNSCYNTPLNSPPKLNLSMMENQIRGSQFPFPPSSRFSSFGSQTLGDTELCKLSRVSNNQSMMKVSGSQVFGFEDKKDGWSLVDGISASERKFSTENGEIGDSREESSVSEQIPGGEIGIKAQNDAKSRKRKAIPRGKAKEIQSSLPAKDAKAAGDSDESNSKRSRSVEAYGKEKAEEKESGKSEGEGNEKQAKDSAKPPEPPKLDYIHVRARRGQATDSHSLAERVRREKIGERMKFLQDLVPGCNKVTGKAVMLDEIINYVQSLQRQVEFLSMKLATVNPRMEINMEALLSKDMLQSGGYVPHSNYSIDRSGPALPYGYQSHQFAPLNSGISSTTTEPHLSMNHLNVALRRNPSMQLPHHIDGFGDSQVGTHLEDDLHSVVQMGFGQHQTQSFSGE